MCFEESGIDTHRNRFLILDYSTIVLFLFLPIRRRVNRYAEVNQSHATDDEGELEEADATANSTILFRYQAALLLSAHRATDVLQILCDAQVLLKSPVESFQLKFHGF